MNLIKKRIRTEKPPLDDESIHAHQTQESPDDVIIEENPTTNDKETDH